MQHAAGAGGRLEPDPVQSGGFHPPCVRHHVHRDATRPDTRQLSSASGVLLQPYLHRRRAAARLQDVLELKATTAAHRHYSQAGRSGRRRQQIHKQLISELYDYIHIYLL